MSASVNLIRKISIVQSQLYLEPQNLSKIYSNNVTGISFYATKPKTEIVAYQHIFECII